MHTYELEIHFNQTMTDVPSIHQHIDCDEATLLDHLGKISTQGVLIHFEDKRRFMPPHSILNIDVTVLERLQIFPDVSESIKSALTEE